MNEERQPLVDPVTPSARPWQQSLIARLRAQARQDRLPHALLIEPGTRTVSRDFGWRLAQALMCAQPGDDACGSCDSCRLMAANSHPDFSFVTRERNPKREGRLNRDISVDQIRQLIHRMTLTGSQQAGRCALIYPAERMNREAANSLLKTLEEPPPGTLMILLSHHPARLPVTIRSRCQHWRVDFPSRDQAEDWLRGQGVDETSIGPALDLAEDDPQQAFQLVDTGFLRMQQDFEHRLQGYLEGRTDAPSLVQQLKDLDSDDWRRLLANRLQRQIREQALAAVDTAGKQRLRQLLDLQARSDRPLQVEETHLNLQLQLEDLLISFKTALHRG